MHIHVVHAGSYLAMADKVVRALNLLGADGDLLNSADGDTFLALIEDYPDNPDGIAPPFNPAINNVVYFA